MVGPDRRATAQGSASTRERLIESAVRLFGERGIAATSLRALTDAAGTNVAAVNYHFGSKEGLLRAAIDQTMRAVNHERRRRLNELESAPEPPSVAALVRAFVEPGADLVDGHGPSGPDIARFLGRVIGEPDPQVRQIFADQVNTVEGRYLAAMRDALPDLDEDHVGFAFTSMLGVLSLHQTGAFRTLEWPQTQGPAPQTDRRAGRSSAADRERLVAFITGGILATLPSGAATDT
ncbi:TetR/AcrR family transcriptional regulator [Actinoallomurus sp. CA-150999]|uniref:TetR/AcrR family transcriptional regulator n=1 Tax=Actinoallomurus sp. CA-150999 TaxID=3239887 RepID=UPI003D914135